MCRQRYCPCRWRPNLRMILHPVKAGNYYLAQCRYCSHLEMKYMTFLLDLLRLRLQWAKIQSDLQQFSFSNQSFLFQKLNFIFIYSKHLYQLKIKINSINIKQKLFKRNKIMSRGPDQSSFLSVSRKREALWNVVQPGDPYDIRKSMIAKVPGDKKAFMGDHLQIVCLFQAAQIQRLCQFLDDFKLKYREIQRRQLDRHSYEVQIKQLTYKLAQQGGFRQENQKLREFLKNQSSSKQGVQDSIKSKYQKLLLQIKGFQDENSKLRRDNENFLYQSTSFDAKFQALQKSKQTQIDDMHMRLSQQSNISFQTQINSLRSQYESQIQRLDLQNRRIKQANQDKGRQIQNWQQKYRILEQQLLRNSPKNDVHKYQKQIVEYESRFVIFGQQIDRLNLVIKQITHKFEISQKKNIQYENKLTSYQQQYLFTQNQSQIAEHQNQQLLKKNSDLQNQNRKLPEAQRYIAEYEFKLKQMSEQITRLMSQLKIQIQTGNRLKADIQRYQYQESRFRILEKQVNEYKQATIQNNGLKMKIAEQENRIAVLKQEIERLRQQLTRKSGQTSNFIEINTNNQRLQRAVQEWERKYQLTVQQYQGKLVQKTNQYESRFQNLNKSKGAQFQSKAMMLQSQVQRLGQLLKRKNQEVQNYQRQIRELQYTITNKYQLDVSRKVQNYESVINNLKQQNQDLRRKIRQLQPLQRRVNEFENKTTITSQEIERLTQQLRGRDNQIQNLRKQIREQQIAIVQKYEMDTSRKIGNYENNLNSLNKQNQEFKRKYTQIQNKAALLSQQIERLTNNMRQVQSKNNQLEQEISRIQRIGKQSQINITRKYQFETNQKISNYETVVRNNQRQNQQLKRRIAELENGNRKLVQYENRLNLMSQELQRAGAAFRQKQQEIVQWDNKNRSLTRDLEDITRKFNQLQLNVRNKYQVQTTRTITTLQQNITTFKRQNDELKRYLQQYQGRLKGQNNDLQSLTLNLRNFSQENQALKRQLKQLQNSYRSKIEVEVTGKYNSYQTNINELKRQLDNLLRQNNELKRLLQTSEQNNIKLNKDNEDLRKRFQQDFGQISKKINEYQARIAQSQNQNQGLRRKVNEYQVVIREKYQIEASRRISTLDQNLANANRQNEQLKRRLEQAIRQFEQLRKVAQNMERDNEQLARRLRQFGDINKKAVQYENRIALVTQELERTNINLRNKVDELGKAQLYIRQLTQKFESTQRNMSQSQSSIQQFQVEVKTRISQYEQNITVLSQQNTELKRRLSILDDMNRKIAEYQNKIVIINQELQRVNINLRNQVQKSNQLQNALRNSTAENEDLKRKINQLQNSIAQKYEVETTRIIRSLQQNIENLQRQNNQLKTILKQYEQRINSQNEQTQKFVFNINGLSEENNMLKNQIRETQISITRKYETQVNSKYSVYERDLTNLKRDNQELLRKLRQYAQRVVPGYQNQIVILKQEIERLSQYSKQQSGQLTSNLKAIGQQNQNLKRQIMQLQQTITQKYQVQVNKKFSIYQQNINVFQKQNQQLKRYITELGGKYEGQLKGMGQNFNLLQRQNEQLKRNLQQIGLRFESQTKKTGAFEQNLNGLGRQNEQLKRRLIDLQQERQKLIRRINELEQENELIRRQTKETQIQITQRYQTETTQQINIYKQQITQFETQGRSLQRENQELQRRLNDAGGDASRRFAKYQEQIKRFSLQIERLNGGIRQYETKIRQLIGENDALKRQVKQTQYSISQRWESQFRAKTSAYQQNIQNINRELQEKQRSIYENSNKRIMELENKAVLLSQQIERLTINLKGKSQQNEKMRLQIQRLNNTLRLKLEETKQFEIQLSKFRTATQSQFSQLQSSYTLVTKQNQNYKKHLTDYQNSIKKLYLQFERLQNIINDLKKQRENLFEKNYALSNEIDRLLNENKELEVQVEDVRLRLSDEVALHKRINQHMALMVILFAEIQSLRKRVKQKEKEVQDVRRSSLAPFKLQSRARGQSL